MQYKFLITRGCKDYGSEIIVTESTEKKYIN